LHGTVVVYQRYRQRSQFPWRVIGRIFGERPIRVIEVFPELRLSLISFN
jgi:hypothetical protein